MITLKTWYFVRCDRCGYTPHDPGGNPLSGLAAFGTQTAALAWLQANWHTVGWEWYCPRCYRETHEGSA